MSLRVSTVGPNGFGTYELDDAGELTPSDGRPDAILAPGFIDIHIHGAQGIDFMSASSPDMKSLCDHLRTLGYEGFLVTTVTASCQEILDTFGRVPEHEMILGFHLEGPFISPQYPGAQPKQFIVPPPDPGSEWDPVLDHPRLRVVTLAPEVPRGLALIKRLHGRGVRVGMGHTAATYAEATAGFVSGATHTTHTFNAMRGFHHREAGMAGFALAEPRLACELIYDRLHVSPDAAKVLVQAKAADKLIAVSDGTAASGLLDGTKLRMWNLDVKVGNGDVRLADGTLAGSAITLLDAFQNLAADFGVEIAIRATSLNPKALL